MLCIMMSQETLRLYTLVPVISREALEDDYLEDLFVPAGTKLMINVQVQYILRSTCHIEL